MRSRAAAKGRKLLFLAAVCLASALLLSPIAEASRGVPSAALNLEPPAPHWNAEAPPAPRHDLFHLEDELLVEILTGVEPEHHQALLEHRRLKLLPTSAIQKTASGVSTSDLRLNVQKGKPLKPELRWTVPFYAKARFYDPEVGRFLTEDPAEPDLTTPPSLHKYLYAYGNPTRYWDPFGLAPEDPDEEPPLNVLVDKIAGSPVGRAVGKATGAVGELANGAGALAGQATEKALRGDTPEDPQVRELQQELGLNPDRPQLGLQPGRTINRQFAQDAGEIVERGTSVAVEEGIYWAGGGAAARATGNLLEATSSARRRIRTGGGYIEVSDNVADGAPLGGGFGRRTRLVVESSTEVKTNQRALISSPEPKPVPSLPAKKSYRPGDVLPDGRIAGQGPGAAHISDPGFSLGLESSFSVGPTTKTRGEIGELLGEPGMKITRTTSAGAARPPRHHIFVQEQRSWFEARGVDIDRYTIELDPGAHSAVHTMGWNRRWSEFKAAEEFLGHPYTTREVLRFGAQLRREFGLRDYALLHFLD